MFSGRKAPWHGLGAVLEEPATVAEAIDASGLGWSVAKERIAVDRGDEPDDDWLLPRCEQIPGYYATVRQDNREVLGIVGERYRMCRTKRRSPSSTSFSAARSTSRRPGARTAAAACGCLPRCPSMLKSVNAVVEYGDWLRPMRSSGQRFARALDDGPEKTRALQIVAAA